jgi:hypothetical protein
MKFEIAEGDDPKFKDMKEWFNILFDGEKLQLSDISGLYLLAEGNVVEGFRVGDTLNIAGNIFGMEQLYRLIAKQAIGKTDRILEKNTHSNAILFYDKLDARFGSTSSHPLAPEIYFELKHVAGHREEDMEGLMKNVISTYEKLSAVNKHIPSKIKLARAIALTCRGKYMCPTNMKKYFKIGGGPSKVQAAGEAIGEELGYNPRRLLKSWILKAHREFGVGEELDREVMRLLRNDKASKIANSSYIAALVYLALTAEASKVGDKITQDKVAGFFDITDVSLRDTVQSYCDRNNFPYRSHARPPEIYALMEEFNTSLGRRPNIGKLKPGSHTLKEYEKLKEIVRFLLDKKHFANNPIPEEELVKKFVSEGDSYAIASRRLQILRRHVSPVKCYMQDSDKAGWRKASYGLELDEERTEAWFKTMDKFISLSKG